MSKHTNTATHDAVRDALAGAVALSNMVATVEPVDVVNDHTRPGKHLTGDIAIRLANGQVELLDVVCVHDPHDVGAVVGKKNFGHGTADRLEAVARSARHIRDNAQEAHASGDITRREMRERYLAALGIEYSSHPGYYDAATAMPARFHAIPFTPMGALYPQAMPFLARTQHTGD